MTTTIQQILGRLNSKTEAAGLPVGKGAFTPHLKIHRYADSVKVIDRTNAGKRGKKVRSMFIREGYGRKDLVQGLLNEIVAAIMPMTFVEALATAKAIADGVGDPPVIRVTEEDPMRGIDVDAPATEIRLEYTLKNGTIMRITATPSEFRVVRSWIIDAPGKEPGTFKAAHGERQDDHYYSRSKKGAPAFYTWLSGHLSEADGMSSEDLKRVWNRLGASWDSH